VHVNLKRSGKLTEREAPALDCSALAINTFAHQTRALFNPGYQLIHETLVKKKSPEGSMDICNEIATNDRC